MRRNFRAGETFDVGQSVQWRNGSHWLDGRINGPMQRDSLGYAFYPVCNLKGTRTISRGAIVSGYCKGLRAKEEI